MPGEYDIDGECLKQNIMEFTGERFVPGIEGWLALQHYHRYYFVINQFGLRDKVVLDIACGEGYGCNILSRSSKFVYGVDISEETIAHAKNLYFEQNIKFLVGTTSSIPLEDNSIDVIVSFETIEHHDQHIEMMQEIKRVLKDNGIFIISSPDKGFYDKHLIGHLNRFHCKELYHEEFVSLINGYFLYSTFFIQNNVIGSLIARENEDCNFKRPLKIEEFSGVSEKIEPRFNICIASDSNLSFSSSISICTNSYYNDFFNIIDEQKKTIENIYKSKTWKIARFISISFRKIKRLIKK
jgi:ubiquinone/menaquinone biosynthesis C-methylase UbiE